MRELRGCGVRAYSAAFGTEDGCVNSLNALTGFALRFGAEYKAGNKTAGCAMLAAPLYACLGATSASTPVHSADELYTHLLSMASTFIRGTGEPMKQTICDDNDRGELGIGMFRE